MHGNLTQRDRIGYQVTLTELPPDIDQDATAVLERPAPRRRDANLDDIEARADAQDRRRLLQDLRQVVATGGLVLHYQPRVSLTDDTVVGAEAIIRWPHRKRGLIPPDRFIPLAEQVGMMGPIGAWVLATGCAEAASWPDQTATLSVAVSQSQILDAGFPSHVAAAIEASGLAPERLELGLTELILLGVDDNSLFMLAALRDMGVGLALDDFGTGFASLAMLRRLPLTTLRIDRALVRGLPDSTEDAAIVRAVVEAAHVVGLTAVAEGIETQAQRDFLIRIGADVGQGYLFGRPIPAEGIREQFAG